MSFEAGSAQAQSPLSKALRGALTREARVSPLMVVGFQQVQEALIEFLQTVDGRKHQACLKIFLQGSEEAFHFPLASAADCT